MAWSDKKLVNEARKRFERMDKSGIDTDTLGILKNNLRVFYTNNKNVRKTSISGISIKKSMSVSQRKEMRQILRSFIHGDSTPQKVQREYNKVVGQYQSQTYKPRKMEKPKTVKEMGEELKRIKNLLNDRKALSFLGSETVKDLWQQQQSNNYDKETVREVINDYVSEVEKLEKKGKRVSRTSSEEFNIILDRIKSRIKADNKEDNSEGWW